jgi:formamidopyrimidine-DNA glycosylase
MPELPEVESLRLKILPKILGSAIQNITLRRKDLRYPMPQDVSEVLSEHRIVGVRRRSKYLLIDFDHGKTLVIHLGMSGRLFFTDPKAPFDKHDHVILNLKDSRQLRFRDPRRFGMLFLCDTEKLSENPFFKNLGVEPLEKEFNPDYLFQISRSSQTAIKTLLMNAEKIVGVGNIYANEALFLSGIKPTRKSFRLTRDDAKVLCQNIKRVLTKSIALGGTTFRDYVDADQKPGLHQLELFVYGREGEKCLQCQKSIKRVVQTGRSSFYCAACQK